VGEREPGADEARQSDDEMTGHDASEPAPDEVARGLDALRELGAEPVPADVVARLDGRLEGELGRTAPVRRRRRRPRLAFALPGAGVALAVAVLVAVLATSDNARPPTQQASLSVRAKAAPPKTPEATAGGGGTADSRAAPKTLTARVRVPALVGHGLGYLESATAARGLKWDELPRATCPKVPSATVKRQVPRAGALVAAGTTIRVSFGKCVRYDAGS
jgi:hypothetical protein